MKKLVLALAAVALIATPALADYSFYGSARVATFYVDDSQEVESEDSGGIPVAPLGTSSIATTDVQAFNVALQGNSRFGLKASTGDVSGRIEYGTGVNLRLLYGEVKLGDGTLLIGQTYTPYTKFSNQAINDDLGFIGFGALYDGRTPQIKYTMDNGLYFAAIQNKANLGNSDFVPATVKVDKIIIPKLVVGYAGKAGDIGYNTGFAYQTVDAKDGIDSEKINSYLLYLCGDAKFGDVGFIYGIHYGQNLTNFGISGRNSSYLGKDAKSYGGMLEADVAGWAFGVGYVNDDMDVDGAEVDADNQITYFVNYTVQVAKGFKIVPEFTYIDRLDNVSFMDDTNTARAFGEKYDGGTFWGVGAKLQMDF